MIINYCILSIQLFQLCGPNSKFESFISSNFFICRILSNFSINCEYLNNWTSEFEENISTHNPQHYVRVNYWLSPHYFSLASSVVKALPHSRSAVSAQVDLRAFMDQPTFGLQAYSYPFYRQWKEYQHTGAGGRRNPTNNHNKGSWIQSSFE